MEKPREVYIANFELRALEPAAYVRIVALRRGYEARLMGLLEEGVSQGALTVADRRHRTG